MGIYAIHYTYPDDLTELMRVRPEHRAWLATVPNLLVAGMYQAAHDEISEGELTEDDPEHGALIVCAADSIEDVTSTFDDDPYLLGGIVLRRVVREWNPPLGAWVADATNSPA